MAHIGASSPTEAKQRKRYGRGACLRRPIRWAETIDWCVDWPETVIHFFLGDRFRIRRQTREVRSSLYVGRYITTAKLDLRESGREQLSGLLCVADAIGRGIARERGHNEK